MIEYNYSLAFPKNLWRINENQTVEFYQHQINEWITSAFTPDMLKNDTTFSSMISEEEARKLVPNVFKQ